MRTGFLARVRWPNVALAAVVVGLLGALVAWPLLSPPPPVLPPGTERVEVPPQRTPSPAPAVQPRQEAAGPAARPTRGRAERSRRAERPMPRRPRPRSRRRTATRPTRAPAPIAATPAPAISNPAPPVTTAPAPPPVARVHAAPPPHREFRGFER
jgi:hypothetical protein